LDYDATQEDLFRESFSEITDTPFLPETSRGVADALAGSGDARSWPALPGTKMEVEEISALMDQGGLDVSLYCGAKGTEDAFYTLSGKSYSIIHLATHGFFLAQAQAVSPEYPSLGGQMLSAKRSSETSSGLVFAGGNNARSNGDTIPGIGDGILSSVEVQALDLTGTDLVVLSACDSGQGSLSGEELFGLQRGFKQAGAGSILMTLSRVDDEATALMMTSFYSALLAGASKHDAFIQAQDRTRERYPQPRYWTPFILLDD
jgi:CHAT domain-containing protein